MKRSLLAALPLRFVKISRHVGYRSPQFQDCVKTGIMDGKFLALERWATYPTDLGIVTL